MKKMLSAVILIAFALTFCIQSIAFAQEAPPEEAVLQEAAERPVVEIPPVESPAEEAPAEPEPAENAPDTSDSAIMAQQFKSRLAEGADVQEGNLPAPQNFAVLLNDPTTLYLMWDKVSGAAGYAIFCWIDDPENGWIVDALAPNETEYFHSGLQTGTVYWYVVAAIEPDNSLGQISWPPQGNMPRQPLPAPAGVKAASNSYNSVKVSWGAVADSVQYAVFRYFDSGAISDLFMVPASSRSYVDKGLTTGKTYMYRVYAVDQYGDLGITHNHIKVVPKVAKPGSFKAAPLSGNKVKLSWAKASGASGYYIYRATSKTGKYSVVKTVGASTAAYTDSKLTSGKTYYYKLVPYRTVEGSKMKGITAGPISAKVK